MRGHIGKNPIASSGPASGNHHRVVNSFVFLQFRFNFPEFNAEAPDLDLPVCPFEVLNISVL
ncbi:MAG TPA: hypothetical protein VGJ30_02895, partial [Candidatus Angelobacter sp.]